MVFHGGFHSALYFPLSEVEHLCASLLTIWISSFVKGLLEYFAHFSIGFSVWFFFFNQKGYVFILELSFCQLCIDIIVADIFKLLIVSVDEWRFLVLI